MGFTQVWGLKGGWLEWEKAGYPTEPKEKVMISGERQRENFN
jgi:3-mercaptopyruvate sulfurtransferase SseA